MVARFRCRMSPVLESKCAAGAEDAGTNSTPTGVGCENRYSKVDLTIECF